MPSVARTFGIAALFAIAGPASAQAVAPAPPAASPAPEDVPTLGEVRAIAPDEEPPVDLYRFRNPVKVEPNRFDRAYQPPPSVKQVSEGGGYLLVGAYYAAAAVAKGLHRLTGGRDPIQATVARPPPLDEAQLQRASAMCDSDGQRCASEQAGH